MEKKDILQAFKQAEIDWSKKDFEDMGFCFYFLSNQLIKRGIMDEFLKPLWKKYATKSSMFHFNNKKERLEVIRKVIKELEK